MLIKWSLIVNVLAAHISGKRQTKSLRFKVAPYLNLCTRNDVKCFLRSGIDFCSFSEALSSIDRNTSSRASKRKNSYTKQQTSKSPSHAQM